MANKFILVPQEIYKGLMTHNTEEPNLEFVRKTLEKTRKKREPSGAKNIKYNQELRRYLKMRDDQQNKPVKVEMVASSKGLTARPISNVDEEKDDNNFIDDSFTSEYLKPFTQDIKPSPAKSAPILTQDLKSSPTKSAPP